MNAIVWFRNDLRLHDNPTLHAAMFSSEKVVPVYVLDPRMFEPTKLGFAKTGIYRAKFLLEALADLRANLQAHGSELLIARGKTELVLPEIALQLDAHAIHYTLEATDEELQVENALRVRLQKQGVALVGHEGKTLYHPEDLPFPITALPEVFTDYRKATEQYALLRAPLLMPTAIPTPSLPHSKLPTLEELGLAEPEPDVRQTAFFTGGETGAIERLNQYFWEEDHLRKYKETRNGMLGQDYSTKFSPWLALGCISPRVIHAEVRRYERERVRNDSTYWLLFELMWRDYFHFVARKHGNKLFQKGGILGLANYPWLQDEGQFQLWATGQTGYPIVDANMLELAKTGFMSNRGRQITASFLTKNLGIDWRMGAGWFESLLTDYDPASNYGNWNYAAGVGNDARGFRYFNPINQSENYDPQGAYVKHWLPVLKSVPASRIHTLWTLTAEEQNRYGVRLGTDYPHAVVDLETSVQENEARYHVAVPDRRKRLGNYKLKEVKRAQGNKKR